MYRNRPVAFVLTGLFLWQTGCTSYKQIGIGEVPDHGKVRVTLRDGRRANVIDPSVDADSLRGRLRRDLPNRTPGNLAIPISQVRSVEIGKINWLATIGLTVFVVGGTVFLVYMWKGISEWSETVDSINRSLN